MFVDDFVKCVVWNLLVGLIDWLDFDNFFDYGCSLSIFDINQICFDMILIMVVLLGEDGESVGDVVFGGNGVGEDGQRVVV